MNDIDQRIKQWLWGTALIGVALVVACVLVSAIAMAISPAIGLTNRYEPTATPVATRTPIKFAVPAWYDLQVYELKGERVIVFIPLRDGTTIEDDFAVIADIEMQALARGLTVIVIPCGMTVLDEKPVCVTYWATVEDFGQ
jgi:hypothetical protein